MGHPGGVGGQWDPQAGGGAVREDNAPPPPHLGDVLLDDAQHHHHAAALVQHHVDALRHQVCGTGRGGDVSHRGEGDGMVEDSLELIPGL